MAFVHSYYKTARWRRLRLAVLAARPLCALCDMRGKRALAEVVHHVRPHKGDAALFFDVNNLEGLCKQCHDGPMQQAERRGYDGTLTAEGWPASPRHPFNVESR